jgi:hypothetical protein
MGIGRTSALRSLLGGKATRRGHRQSDLMIRTGNSWNQTQLRLTYLHAPEIETLARAGSATVSRLLDLFVSDLEFRYEP